MAPTALLPTAAASRRAAKVVLCLRSGLRIVTPMTYMAIGGLRRPRGAWIPSVLY